MLAPRFALPASLPFLAGVAAIAHGCGDARPRPAPTPPAFAEVAAQAGIDFVHVTGARGDYDNPETFGSGGGWVDVDGDGWLDLYLVNGGDLRPRVAGAGNRLYRNLGADGGGARFADVTDAAGAGGRGYGMGFSAADVEGDGDVDLFVANVGPNALLLQDGGRFVDVASGLGVADPRWTTGSGFADLDLDGDLDLAAVNYVDPLLEHSPVCRQGSIRTYCDPDAYPPQADLLYRNDTVAGRPQLMEVAEAAGFRGVSRSLSVSLVDADLDGDTDVFVANDGQANSLYRNDTAAGELRLVEDGLAAGVRFSMEGRAQAGMGSDFGDVDGDGWPDLVVANFSRETNTYYHHFGSGLRFEDATGPAGLSVPSFLPLGFGAALFDADGDGDLDLAVANGHVLDRVADIDPSLSHAQPDQLFLNVGGVFTECPTGLGVATSEPRVSRALAVGDYDNDGDEDLLITANGDRPRLLRNDMPGTRWLTLRLASAAPGNAAALGARVEVRRDDGIALARQVRTGGSYLSARDPRLHVGMAAAASAEVMVWWPGGGVDRWVLAAGDHLLTRGGAPGQP